MKKFILPILFTLISVGVFAQTEEEITIEDDVSSEIQAFMTEVEYDVDASVFSEKEGNTYINSEKTAGIVALYLPYNFDVMEEQFLDGSAEGEDETLDKDSFEVDGVRYMYLKQITLVNEVNATYAVYCKENDDKSVLMISGYYENSDKAELYDSLIKKAALSAKVKE